MQLKTPPEYGEGSLFGEAILATLVTSDIFLVSHLNLNFSNFCLLVQIYQESESQIGHKQRAISLNNHNGGNLCDNVRSVLDVLQVFSYLTFTKTL